MKDGENQGIWRGSAQNLVASLLAAVVGFTLTLVVTRSTTTTEAGLFFVATSATVVLGIILRGGADVGLIRFLSLLRSRHDGHGQRRLLIHVLRVVSSVSVIAAGAAWGLAPWFADLLGGGDVLTYRIRMLSLALPFLVAHQVLSQGSRGFGTMSIYNGTERILRPVLQLASVAGVVLLGLSVDIFAAWLFVFVPVAVLTTLLMYRRTTDTHAQEGVPRRKFWSFALPRGGASLLEAAASRLDVMLVAGLASAGAAGIYAASVRFAGLASLPHGALVSAVQPAYAWAFGRQDVESAGAVFKQTAAVDMAVTWPVAAVLLLHAEDLLPIFGSQYVAGGSVVRILALGILVQSGTGTVGALLLMYGRSDLNLVTKGTAVVASLVLAVALIPGHGAVGAAYAWGAGIVVDNAMQLLFVRRVIGVHPVSRRYVLVIGDVASLVVVDLVVRAALPDLLLARVVALATGGAIYLAMLHRQGLISEVFQAFQRRGRAPLE